MEIQRKPIALISDLFGNLSALNTVLSEIEELKISSVYAIGNLVFGGANPLEVWKRLQDAHVSCLRGPTDRALGQLNFDKLQAHSGADRKQIELFKETHSQLGELVVERLLRLPDQIRLPLWDGSEMLLMYGSPSDPLIEISAEMTDDEIMAVIADDPADIFVCSGAHVQFSRTIEELTIVGLGTSGKLAVDPSTGEKKWVPLTIVTPQMSGPQIEQRWLELIS